MVASLDISFKKNCKKCVKTLYPCSSHQNSWDLWMFIPLKMVLIGIDPYPNGSLNGMIIRKSMIINEHWTSSNQHWNGKIMKIKPLLEHPGRVDSNFNGSRPDFLWRGPTTILIKLVDCSSSLLRKHKKKLGRFRVYSPCFLIAALQVCCRVQFISPPFQSKVQRLIKWIFPWKMVIFHSFLCVYQRLIKPRIYLNLLLQCVQIQPLPGPREKLQLLLRNSTETGGENWAELTQT